MSAKNAADRKVAAYPWTARQARMKKSNRKTRKQARKAGRNT